MSLNNEHRGRPQIAAYHDPQVAAPEAPTHRRQMTVAARAWSELKGATATVGEWIIDGWKWVAAALTVSGSAFLAVLILQHYWPNETMAAWGPAWRLGLIVGGSVALIGVLLDWVMPRSPRTCYTCGADLTEVVR